MSAGLRRKYKIWRKCDDLLINMENRFWFMGNKFHKNSREAVFLHSLFRSGSTYLFNKFRGEEKFWCYYEPLHHQLVQLRKDKLEVFSFDKHAAEKMGHPQLQQPHFFEYLTALDNNRLPYFNVQMSYAEFAKVQQQARLYKYLNMLIEAAPEDRIPLLQFNRSSLRIGWLKKHFRNALHIYLLRNHRNQFESYFKPKKGHKYNIFLAVNLYILAANSDYGHFDAAYSLFSKDFQLSNNFYKDLKKIGSLLPEIDPKIHYTVFLHLWVTSYVEAKKHADFVLDMDGLSQSGEYREMVIDLLFQKYGLASSVFNDCSVKIYENFSLDDNSFRSVEKEVQELYKVNIEEMGYGTHTSIIENALH